MELTVIIKGNLLDPTHWASQLYLSINVETKIELNRNLIFPYTYENTNPVLLDGRDTPLIEKLTQEQEEYCVITTEFNTTTSYFTFRLHSSNIELQEVKCNMDVILADNPVVKLMNCHITGVALDAKPELTEEEACEEQWHIDNGLLTPTQIHTLEMANKSKYYSQCRRLIREVFPDKEIKTLQGGKIFSRKVLNENHYCLTQIKE